MQKITNSPNAMINRVDKKFWKGIKGEPKIPVEYGQSPAIETGPIHHGVIVPTLPLTSV
jgi:hypothetical protein